MPIVSNRTGHIIDIRGKQLAPLEKTHVETGTYHCEPVTKKGDLPLRGRDIRIDRDVSIGVNGRLYNVYLGRKSDALCHDPCLYYDDINWDIFAIFIIIVFAICLIISLEVGRIYRAQTR